MVNELYHHGIKGQRWGVRRYQDANGYLTEAGLSRYRQKLVSKYKKNKTYVKRQQKVDKAKQESGIVVGSNDDTIKSGSKIYRYADAGETLDSNRKYASLTFDDRVRYSQAALDGKLYLKDESTMTEYIYEAATDLKVASGKNVCDYVFSKYGNTKLRELYDISNDLLLSYRMDADKVKLSKKDKQIMESAQRTAYQTEELIGRFLNNTIMSKETSNDIMEHYRKLGYDAIVDLEDSGGADYPIILLDPKKSVKLIHETT